MLTWLPWAYTWSLAVPLFVIVRLACPTQMLSPPPETTVTSEPGPFDR